MPQTYPLWGRGFWYDCIFDVEKREQPTVRSMFPKDWSGEGTNVEVDLELVPDPSGPHGRSSMSVRLEGRLIGFLDAEQGRIWAGVVRRVLASGFVPVTRGRIFARQYEAFKGTEFWANVQVCLGDPSDALPRNEPPALRYTMLPRSAIVQVTKEDEYSDALLKILPTGGHGVYFVTLHERAPEGRGKPLVEVRIDDQCVGLLSSQMSQRFLPLIRHLRDRGLLAACWGDVTGSAVAAEVRIDAVKANEASSELLSGPPVTVPALVPELSDPSLYDITATLSQLKPLPPVAPEKPRATLAEPPEWAVIRFVKAKRYNYVAVRIGDRWETTSTGNWGGIDPVMSWEELAPFVPEFDYAVSLDWVSPSNDPRIRQHLAVVCFSFDNHYVSAINVDEGGSFDGNWYTTSGECVTWAAIAASAQGLQVVTAWSHYG